MRERKEARVTSGFFLKQPGDWWYHSLRENPGGGASVEKEKNSVLNVLNVTYMLGIRVRMPSRALDVQLSGSHARSKI